MPDQGPQPQDVFAATPAEEPKALAFALLRCADTDVIERPHPESVDGEPPPSDVAANFAERVELGLPVRGDAEHPDPVLIGGSVQPDYAGWGGGRYHHPILATNPKIRRSVRCSLSVRPLQRGMCPALSECATSPLQLLQHFREHRSDIPGIIVAAVVGSFQFEPGEGHRLWEPDLSREQSANCKQ